MEETLLILAIFCLRVFNNALGTVRIIVMTNGRRRLAFVLAFIESMIFAYTAAQVLTDLDNVGRLIAYALGFAVGGYIGMLIEDRYIVGFVTVNITVPTDGQQIAAALREKGFGVTLTLGHGAHGEVATLRSVVDRTQAKEVSDIALGIRPKAFITIEGARAVNYGWLRARRTHHR